MEFFIYYVLLVNIFGMGLMFIDKRKARKHQWRVPERTLFITAIFLGSAGIWLGMYIYRHKTKHPSFVIGIPAVIIIQIYLLVRYVF